MARKFECGTGNYIGKEVEQIINNTATLEKNINKTDSLINHSGTDINTISTVINAVGTLGEKTNIDQKICGNCGKEFKSISSCRSHKSRGTCKKEKKDPCKCTRCLKVFKNPNSKRNHMSRNTCVAAPVPEVPPPRRCRRRAKNPDDQKRNLWIQQFGDAFEVKCLCGQTMTPCWGGNPKSHLCNIKSHSNGGSMDDTNLYWACHRCNGNSVQDFLTEISERYGRNSTTYKLFKTDFQRLGKIFEEP